MKLRKREKSERENIIVMASKINCVCGCGCGGQPSCPSIPTHAIGESLPEYTATLQKVRHRGQLVAMNGV